MLLSPSELPTATAAKVIDKSPLFWQYRDGPWLPTLRLLHRVPTMMPKVQVDKGATCVRLGAPALGTSSGAGCCQQEGPRKSQRSASPCVSACVSRLFIFTTLTSHRRRYCSLGTVAVLYW